MSRKIENVQGAANGAVARLGIPQEGAPETHPRYVAAKTKTYVMNNDDVLQRRC